MENQFCVQQCRFHVLDQHFFLIWGYWRGGKKKHNRIMVSLDYKTIPFSEGTGPHIDATVYSPLQGPCNLWVSLPDNYEEYKMLRVFERNGTDLLEVFHIETRKMKKAWRPFQVYIDEVKRDQSDLWVSGWYIASGKVKFRLTDKNGAQQKIELWLIRRPDVENTFPEADVDCVRGFRFRADATGEPMKLVIGCPAGRRRIDISAGYAGILGKRGEVSELLRKAQVYYQQFGMRQTILRCAEKISGKEKSIYDTFRMVHTPDKGTLKEQCKEKFPIEPAFAIVVPIYRTPIPYLDAMVRSVRAQTYGQWRLYLSDGSGPLSPLTEKLEKYAAEDGRIEVLHNEERLQIAENTNRALERVREDYIVFLDHDDLLTPDALYECACVVNETEDVDLIYSDEDKVSANGKRYFQPHFKPDFNLDFLRSLNYICHMLVVSRRLFEQTGYLREKYDGAQDYDFILRCIEKIEKTERIVHIPKVLYHWRKCSGSAAGGIRNKAYICEAGRQAILAHYKRVGIDAEVHFMSQGYYRTIYRMKDKPLVSVIIPNKDHREDLQRCMESLNREGVYDNLEILIVENNSETQEIMDYYRELEASCENVRILYYDKEFNYADIQNFAAVRARGEYLLLLNNDVRMIGNEGIEELLGYCRRKDVGVVGARLFYPDDTIQHAGVIVGLGGVAGHSFLGLSAKNLGYFLRAVCAQDYSAVTAACMMVRKDVFLQVGGMDTALRVAFNDTDFCLRVGELGYRIVYNPFSVWYHDESKTRGIEDTPEKMERFQQEIQFFRDRWTSFLDKGDPAYNPNLTLDKHDFSLRI